MSPLVSIEDIKGEGIVCHFYLILIHQPELAKQSSDNRPAAVRNIAYFPLSKVRGKNQ